VRTEKKDKLENQDENDQTNFKSRYRNRYPFTWQSVKKNKRDI